MDILRLYRQVAFFGEHTITGLVREVDLRSGDWLFSLTTRDGATIRTSTPGEAVYRVIEEAIEKVPQINLMVINKLWPAILPDQVESIEQALEKLPKSLNSQSLSGLKLTDVAKCYSKDINGHTLNELGREHKVTSDGLVSSSLGQLSVPVENYLSGLGVPVVPSKLQNPVQALLDGQSLQGRSIRFAIAALPFSAHKEDAAVLLAQNSLFDTIQVEDLLFAAPSKRLIETLTSNEMINFPVGVIYQLMQHTKRPRPDVHIPYSWMNSKTVEKMCYSAVQQNSPKCCEHLLKWDILQGNDRFKPLRELLMSRLEGDYKRKYHSA